MTQEAAETKPTATKATAKKTPRPKALTLQQKFIKLREAIPAIVKAKHSEGVEYKFAKISDVYRLLTPAMNEHGVNFDIVAETATRHTPEGDPLYNHHYTINERGVQRVVWVYEEDLTIRWTNADNPEDDRRTDRRTYRNKPKGDRERRCSQWHGSKSTNNLKITGSCWRLPTSWKSNRLTCWAF